MVDSRVFAGVVLSSVLLCVVYLLQWEDLACPGPVPEETVLLPEPCTRHFVRYIPSVWEQHWVAHAKLYQADFGQACAEIEARTGRTAAWLKFVSQRAQAGASTAAKTDVPSHADEVLSLFVHLDNCTGTHVVSPIEPLVGFLRHPFLHCKRGPLHVDDKSYLVIPAVSEVDPGQRLFFDAGAGTYAMGDGGPSQQWFAETFSRMGLRPDRYFAWEASVIPSLEIWADVPAWLRPRMSYYNIPISPAPRSPDNILNFIRAVSVPQDFVVFKLDVDNSTVENAIIEQLLEDPYLHTLVDELYWEHHTGMTPMREYGWGDGWGNHTMASSYALFSRLRRAGIRAHSWV
eukprot:RCo034277